MGLTGGEGNTGKMAKNCMKMTKSAFWVKAVGWGWTWGGQANFLGSRGWGQSPHQGKPCF